MEFVRLASSLVGRVARAAVGVLLVLLGLFVIQGSVGWIVAAIGLVPIAAGVFDFCLLAPLMGAPFKGAEARAMPTHAR